jgi:hypothetical protein
MKKRRRARRRQWFVTFTGDEPEFDTDNLRVAPNTITEEYGIEEDFAAYDKMPLLLRRTLQDVNARFSSVATLREWNANGPLTLLLIHHSEANDVVRFARAYKQSCGLDYPHTAAKATILRYGKR